MSLFQTEQEKHCTNSTLSCHKLNGILFKVRGLEGHSVEPRANHVPTSGIHCSFSGLPVAVAGIPTGPAGPHGPPPVGPPGPHGHPHPGSVAAAQLEAAERLALSTDPMVRLQMAGISPEYHAHTHAHTHAHSHTHLHLHPSQQAQQAQAQEAAAAAGTAGFPLPGEWYYPAPDKLKKLLPGQYHFVPGPWSHVIIIIDFSLYAVGGLSVCFL